MNCERPPADTSCLPGPAEDREMNTRLIISLLCAGALAFAFACGPRSHTPSPVALASAAPSGTANEVRLALVITNVGNKHAELDFPSGQSYDFVVVDSTGREVWRWAQGRMFTQSVQNHQLGTHDTMRVAESWSPAKMSAKPGRYTAIATLNSTNYPVEERAEFVLP
jgi:hypothetical protein